MTEKEQELRREILSLHIKNAMLMQSVMAARVEFRTDVVNIATSINKTAEAAIEKELHRLNSLKKDTISVMKLLIDKGFVTADELNEAVKNG